MNMDVGTPSPSSRKGAPSFRLEFPGSPGVRDECQQKMKRMKSILREEKLSNTEVLRRSLDFFISNSNEENCQQNKQQDGQFHNTYLRAERTDTDQPLFLTAADSCQNLITTTESHSKICRAPLLVSDQTCRGAVTILRLQCDHGHGYNISTSPYLPNGKFLCNFRLIHAYICSGILPSQFGSLCESLGFSTEIARPEMSSIFPFFGDATKEEKSLSCDTAIREEVGLSVDDSGEIEIMTDARHGHGNANDTNVVYIGNKTHKVLTDIHVTKMDDPVAQRHELLGTKRMYQYSDSFLDCVGGPMRIKSHAHDRNASVNKFIRRERTDTLNQNDTWHAAKSVQKEIARVAKGPLYREGKSWHRELSDKVNSVRTHVQYSMCTCEGNSDATRSSLDNVVSHYKNEHDKCNPHSRCKTDPNYEPSKLIIQSPEAEQMLRTFKISRYTAIRNTCMYKNAEDYALSMDTYHVESFNNVLNVFLDKRNNA